MQAPPALWVANVDDQSLQPYRGYGSYSSRPVPGLPHLICTGFGPFSFHTDRVSPAGCLRPAHAFLRVSGLCLVGQTGTSLLNASNMHCPIFSLRQERNLFHPPVFLQLRIFNYYTSRSTPVSDLRPRVSCPHSAKAFPQLLTPGSRVPHLLIASRGRTALIALGPGCRRLSNASRSSLMSNMPPRVLRPTSSLCAYFQAFRLLIASRNESCSSL